MFSANALHSKCYLRLIRNKWNGLCIVSRCSSTALSNSSMGDASAVIESVAKPKTNVPFIKDFFLGKFEPNLLVFPEIESTDDLLEFHKKIEPVEKFFHESDFRDIDQKASIPEDILKQLKEFGLFGQQIPQDYGGQGMTCMQLARMSEVTALDGSIAATLSAHQSAGLKGILIFGTDEQKRKYLPRLASGDFVAAFCLTESSGGTDAAAIETRAKLSEDGQTYYLTGNKRWITNGGIADIFTVFAKTEIKTDTGEVHDKVTAFIVERDFGGVSHGNPDDKLGIRGANTCEVHFANTPVPVENVISEVGLGFQVAMTIINSGRFMTGSTGAAILKRLLYETTEYAISRSLFSKKLHEFELIQEKLGKMAVQVYAMESMSYLTAGIMDMYQEPDLSLESALVKIFTTESLWHCVSECLHILGGMGYMKEFPYEQYLRDSRALFLYEGTNEMLRLLVSMSGLQHAGKELIDTVRRMRDPLNNLGFIFKKVFPQQMSFRREPKLAMKLHDYAHPTLVEAAQTLERSLLKFKIVVQDELNVHADNLMNRQMDLRRLSNIVTDIYAMVAVIGRASRSISIGLRHCDHEAMLAHTFCHEANERIMQNFKELTVGDFHNLDENYRILAKDMAQNHGYVPVHPLTKNW